MKKNLITLFSLLLAAVNPALAQVPRTGGSGNAPMYQFNPNYDVTAEDVLYNGDETSLSGTVFQSIGVLGAVTYITDLGFYAGTNGEWAGNGGSEGASGTLQNNHLIILYGPTAANPVTTASLSFTNNVVASATVMAGSPVDANGYAWVTLPSPVALAPGGWYVLLATNQPLTEDAGVAPYDFQSPEHACIVGPTGLVLTNGVDAPAPFSIYEGCYGYGLYNYAYSVYMGPNMEYTNLSVGATNAPVAFQQNVTSMAVTNFANYPLNLSVIVTGTPPISLEWYGNGAGIANSVTSDYQFFADTNSYLNQESLAQNGELFYCVVSNQAETPALTSYTAQSGTITNYVLNNNAYPQEYLHGSPSATTNFFVGNSSANQYSGQVGGLITVGNYGNVLVTHLGYYAEGLINLSQAALTDNHRLSIYQWNNGSPTLLGWTLVTNGTLASSQVNGYLWAPLNPPLVLTAGTQYLVTAETTNNADVWGDVYGVPDLNPYFASAVSAVSGSAGWPSAPTSVGNAHEMYSAVNLASLTNFAAVYVSNSISPNAVTYASNITNAWGASLTLIGWAEGQAPLYYPQWYYTSNNVTKLLPNQNNMLLSFSSLNNTNIGSYYLVVSNYQTSVTVTNELTTVTVNPAPTIVTQLPITYTNGFNSVGNVTTNFMTLYAGASPKFSVTAVGSPLAYHWLTNGVTVGGASSASFTAANIQIQGSVNLYCVVSNTASLSTATSVVWSATILADPLNSSGGLAQYPQAVLALNPIGYWRMNDTNEDGVDNGNGDNGYECHDYAGGNDGMYSNAILGNVGYNSTEDPSDTSPLFGDDPNPETSLNGGDEDANYINGINFNTAAGANATFTVEAWVSGYEGELSSAGIVSLGYSGGEQFCMDCGAPNSAFRFFIRDASGATHIVNSTVQASITGGQGPWYHLVGVVNETGAGVSFYINGQLVGTAPVTVGSGILSSTNPMVIGARSSAINTNNNDQFEGYINDVSVFNYALSSSQVLNEYLQGGQAAPYFTPPPPSSVVVQPGGTLVLSSTAAGSPVLGYQWENQTTSTVLVSGTGTTNGTSLNVGYTNNSVPGNWDGNTLELTVTNAYGTTNVSVMLTVTNAPQITTNLPPAVAASVGQTYTYYFGVSGGIPLIFQWYEAGSTVSHATNATFMPSTSSVSTNYIYAVVTNTYGSVTSVISTFIVIPLPNTSLASAIRGLNPVGYWPMHEVEAPAPGDIETNYGSLGNLANGYYPDWTGDAATGAFERDFLPNPVAIPDEPTHGSTYFTFPGSNGGSTTNAMYVPVASPSAVLRPPFTVECWFNRYTGSSIAANQGDLWSQSGFAGLNTGEIGSGSSGYAGIRLYNNGTSFSIYGQNNNNNDPLSTPSGSTAFLDSWEHIVVTCDAQTNMSIFTNGILYGTSVSYVGLFTPNYWTPFAVGSGRGNTRSLSGCAIGDVAIYTNVLPALTISNHYQIGIGNVSADYFTTISNQIAPYNPTIYLRMDSPTWSLNSIPPSGTWPALYNYGSVAQNGIYSPGTMPGIVAGPTSSALGYTNADVGTNMALLSGVSSFGDAGYNPVWDPSATYGTGSNAFSVACTFRGNPADGRWQCLVGHGSSDWGLYLNANDGGGGTGGDVNWKFGGAQANSSAVCNDGNWHQVVGVYQPAAPNSAVSGTLNLYVDGTLSGTASVSSNGITAATPNYDVMLGTAPDGTNDDIQTAINQNGGTGPTSLGQQFAGQLCDVAIFTNALSAQQVDSLYTAAGGHPVAVSLSSSYLPITRTNLGTTNLMTLYAGASPSFYISASGVPLNYQWYVNGTALGYGTGPILTLTNVEGSFTAYCIVTNSLNSVTSVVWSASVVQDPDYAGSFSQTIMSDNPLAYWRLNDPKGSLIADDYAGGANGLYGSQTTNGAPGVPILPGGAPESGVFMDPTASSEANGSVTNSGLILNGNAITFVVWVYPDAAEADYTGVFINRSTAGDSGVSYSSTPAWGYNWDGSYFSYNSGLGLPPTSQWSMGVVEIYPQNYTTLAVYNSSGVHYATNNPSVNSLTSFYGGNEIGCDPNGGVTRIFYGEMNELAIFNYDLSQAQLNTLYYAATNAVNISLIPTTPTNIVVSVTNNSLYLSWPSSYTGWQLQAQTNTVRVGIGTNWANYNPATGPSTGTNQVVIPVNLTNGTVFYRLIYTP